MPALPSPRRLLWRYNYAILAGTGYWVIVLPVAASQIVTLWMMAIASGFNQILATRIAELMSPILGAFLVAHTLAPEYRSGVGAVLACKPVSLHRVITIRVALALLAPVLLTMVTLEICNAGLMPIDVWSPLVASLPSLWFLALLALTCATVLRSALGGFAVAAGVWVLDLAVGYDVQPLLSLQGMAAHLDADPLSDLWVLGKAILLVAGSLLLWLHGRLLYRICQPAERRDLVKTVAAAGAALLLYSASGAATMVGYAYRHRAELPTPDPFWLRRQLAAYGPVPVATLFGPAFTAYVTQPALRSGQDAGSTRLAQLEAAKARWPRSIWADGIAFALATEREQVDPARAAAEYFSVASRFPDSPFAPKALARIVRGPDRAMSHEDRLRAARSILARYAAAHEVEAAAAQLADDYPGAVHAPELAAGARSAAEVAPRFRRLTWLVVQARAEADAGQIAAALATARTAASESAALRSEAGSGPTARSDLTNHLAEIDAARRDADGLIGRLGGR